MTSIQISKILVNNEATSHEVLDTLQSFLGLIAEKVLSKANSIYFTEKNEDLVADSLKLLSKSVYSREYQIDILSILQACELYFDRVSVISGKFREISILESNYEIVVSNPSHTLLKHYQDSILEVDIVISYAGLPRIRITRQGQIEFAKFNNEQFNEGFVCFLKEYFNER
ncbi:MAG: hypothetical protein V4654_12320 [Bdellovibrionota bacterium]